MEFWQISSYLPEQFRQISSNLPEQFRQITSSFAYFQIVTDLIIASSVNQNLANIMLSLIIIIWLYMGTLPCMMVSVWLFLYNVSLVSALALVNCQGVVQVSLTHQWSWIHECKSRTIRMVCILIVTSLLILTMGQDFYQVS